MPDLCLVCHYKMQILKWDNFTVLCLSLLYKCVQKTAVNKVTTNVLCRYITEVILNVYSAIHKFILFEIVLYFHVGTDTPNSNVHHVVNAQYKIKPQMTVDILMQWMKFTLYIYRMLVQSSRDRIKVNAALKTLFPRSMPKVFPLVYHHHEAEK